jgi:hypothetical protein
MRIRNPSPGAGRAVQAGRFLNFLKKDEVAMRILTANLKFFYQRRGMWLVYCFFLLFSAAFLVAVFSSNPDRRNHVFLFNALMVSLCFGVVCASLWKEALGKAFSFCLPNSRTIPRNMVFLAGVALNVLIALLFAYSRRPETLSAALPLFLPVFFTGMGVFLMGVFSMYQTAFQHLWRLIFFTFPLMAFQFVTKSVEDTLITHSQIIMPIGIGLCVLVWIWMGRKSLRRALCLTPSYSLFDSWNPAKIKQIREQRAARKMNSSDERRRERRETFFVARMKQYDVLSVGRDVWGWLYRFYGNPILKVYPSLILIALLVLLFAYIPTRPMQLWILLMPVIVMGGNLPLPFKQSLLLPAGRKDLYRLVLILLPVYSVLAVVFYATCGVFWQGIFLLVPQVTIRNQTYTCTAFRWEGLAMIPLFIAFCFLLRRFTPRENGFAKALTSMIMIPLFAVVTFLFDHVVSLESAWPFLLIATAAMWALCILAYRNYFQYSRLTWEGRG